MLNRTIFSNLSLIYIIPFLPLLLGKGWGEVKYKSFRLGTKYLYSLNLNELIKQRNRLLTLILILTIFLLYLVHERILLNRQLNSISIRIAVTGTRGKSSVVRLLASILREDGRKVLAKTTGAEAKYILLDGEEIDVPRKRFVSIIEQKNLIKKAAKLNADYVVAEIMSIHPENHYVESQQILKPNIVVITNVRKDHTDAMGRTIEEIASVFSLDIAKNAYLIILEKENKPIFTSTVKNAGGKLIQVKDKISSLIKQYAPELMDKEFPENINLVYALAECLNITTKSILNGMRKVKHDVGKFKIWKYKLDKTEKIYYLVNGFAANDPESTLQVILKLKQILPSSSNKIVGLLNLRSDRGDRTLQWIEALKNDGFNNFDKIYVTGSHAKIVKRKLKQVKILNYKSPEKISEAIMRETENQAAIFGFGNIAGTGRLLVDYWNEVGEDYGL